MFYSPHNRGQIEVICGCMFSGKSEELIRRLRRVTYARQKLQVFKPAQDTRDGKAAVVSRAKVEFPAQVVTTALDALALVHADTKVVGLDEIQFFDPGVLELCETLADRGVRVIAAGLDQDFGGKPFGPMPNLMAVAEYVTKLPAVCVVCGEPAFRSRRKSGSTAQVEVGSDNYEARCRIHHKE